MFQRLLNSFFYFLSFFALFNESVSTSHFRKHEYDTFSSMGGVAFLQSAGDIIVMPGGWPHFVYNLTPTVAFGGSHLRLEGLSMLEKNHNGKAFIFFLQSTS